MAEETTITVDETTEVVTVTVTDAQEIELRNNGTYIQWKRENLTAWTNLVALDSLKPSPLIFVKNEKQAVTNTTDETDLCDGTDYEGSYTLAADSLEKGDLLTFAVRGTVSSAVGQSTRIRLYLGSSVVIDSTETIPSNLSGMAFELCLCVRVISTGATGTVFGIGNILIQTAQGVAAPVFRVLKSANDVQLNTTISNDIRVTYKWGAASASNILNTYVFKVTKERVNI